MQGGVTTRAQTRAAEAARQAAQAHSSSSSSSSSKLQPKTRKQAAPTITADHCMAFIANPRKDPITGKKIMPGSAVYNKYINRCAHILGDENIPVIVASNILKDNSSIANRVYNDKICISMVNKSLEYSTRHHEKRVYDPFSKNTRWYHVNSANGKKLLDTCKDEFGVIMIHILVREQEFRLNVPVYIHLDGGVQVENVAAIREALSAWIDRATIHVPREEVFTEVIDCVDKIIKSQMINRGTRVILEDMLMELQAMKMGINMSRDSVESPESSPMNSANRSRTKSVPQGMEPLPSGTRKHILEELERTCIDMLDMITLNDFNDMKKKDLQLIIGIGKGNKEGQKRCYHVKSIYNFVKSAVKQGLVPKEPMSKEPITHDDIHNVILPRMRYIKPDARDPGHVDKKKYPALELEIRNVIRTDTQEPYFEITLKRFIGRQLYWSRSIGYIPSNIDTNSADINSAAVIAKVRDLFDNGRLVDRRMQMRAHLNKSLQYWDDDRERKLALMVRELSGL